MKDDSRFSIRSLRVTDAEVIAKMAGEHTAYLQALGDDVTYCLTAEQIRRHGFGADPAFRGIIAEAGDVALGYLLHHPGFDPDRAERYLVVCDLFVRAAGRRQGIGRALMSAAMGHCRATGASGVHWSVYKPNTAAAAFYRSLGAKPIESLDFMWWPAN
jgi:GNAT superfamily N-acetyltransferase